MNLVIFDIDGTLVESVRIDSDCFVRAFEEAFAIRGIDTAWERYEHATDPWITRAILRRHFRREPREAELARVRGAFLQLIARAGGHDSFQEIPGARSALRRLSAEAGWQSAVASGSWRETGLLKLQSAGLAWQPFVAAFGDDALTREDIIRTARRRAEEHHGRAARRVAYVGDAIWDVRTCRNLGLPFVGVGRNGHAEMLRAAGAATVVADYCDFGAFRRALETAEVPR
jgi:phosphoglycolate phosphatase-like HAD superfamily hydrolase